MAASKKAGSLENLRREVLTSLTSIISSCGGECQLDSLFRDYKDLTGSPVPVKQLNHGTLASFLFSVPEIFHCSNRGGQVYVKVKDDKNTNHIAKLVARQQKSAKRKITRPKPARRPGPSSWAPAHDAWNVRRDLELNWRQPFRPVQPMNYAGFRPRRAGENQGRFYIPPGRQANFRADFAPRSQEPPRRPENRSSLKSFPPGKPKSPPPLLSKSPPPGKSKSPPLINARPALLPTPPTPPITPITPITHVPKTNPLFYNDGNFNFPRGIRDNQDKQYAPYFEVPPRFKKVENKPAVLTCKQKLEEEMKKRNLKQDLVFRSIPCGKKKQHWVSLVTINGVNVSSYPEEYQQVQEAEEEVARKALELLQRQENTHLPVTRDLNVSIERVKKIISSQDSVLLWLEHVQDLYKKEYKEVLPDNWAKDVKNYNEAKNITYGVVVDNPVLNRWTVQLKEKEQEKPTNMAPTNTMPQRTTNIMAQHLSQPEISNVESTVLYERMRQMYATPHNDTYPKTEIYQQADPKTNVEVYDQNVNSINLVASELGGIEIKDNEDEDNQEQRLPSLELPMSNYWDIYVTYIEDLSSIHFRLIGDMYSSAYDDMVTEMELHYMEDKNMSPVPEPKIGYIYAASHDESWCRVKVMKILENEATVSFLDHGDQETISISQLHDLHEQFFKLPAQGVCCSLAGLEFGGRDQSALNLLQNLALGQTLVAQVVSRGGNMSSLILYNTSTEDDVNINEKVSEQMDLNFVEPTLPSVGGVAEVYVIHTTSSGDVYVQVETETYKVLQNLLEIARSRTEEMLGEGEDVKIDLARLYLARFSEDGEWYRAVPRADVDPNGKVLMWFVDFGNSDRVPTGSIRPLEVNDKLTKIPHQALLCRLHNVPSSEGLQWTSRTCQRILDLIPDDSPLLLKVHESGSNGGPPQVELFKRLHPKNELVSINATLSMDESLFSPDGDSNNNSLRKEIVLSPSRTRNRYGSGSSGTHSGPSSGQYETTSRANSPLDMSKRFQQPGSLLPMDLPAIGEFFDVYVTYAASPSNFAVQPWKMHKEVRTLMEGMQAYYSNPENLKTDIDIKKEEYYAVKHTDSCWYRAYLTMANESIITGLFVDFGDYFVSSRECAQPLPSVFHSLPCQAIKAKLAGVGAANMDWRPEDSFRFKELVEYHELVSIITNIEREKDTEEYVLSLRLIDTSDPVEDVFIDDLLIQEKRAIKFTE